MVSQSSAGRVSSSASEPLGASTPAEPRKPDSPAIRRFAERVLGVATPHAMGLMALRSLTIAAKFALTIFIARYLGLADVGVYGLITSAAVIAPVLLGFGVANHLCRDAVRFGPPSIAVRLLQYFAFLLPLYALAAVGGAVVLPSRAAPLAGLSLLMLLEHIQTDMFALMVITGRAYVANVINFIRAAGWVLAYVPLALVDPGLRSIEAVGVFWLGGCVAATLLTVGFTRDWRWRSALAQLPSRPFTLPHRHGSPALYLNDLANTLFLYVDRYVVGVFLSPKMLGIYVLFWSITNAISNLVTTAIVQPRRGELVQVVHRAALSFNKEVWKLTFTTTQITVAMSIAAIALIYAAAPFIGRPEIYPYLPLMFLLCAGLVLRAAYEVVGIAFYAHRRDDITLYSGGAILVVALGLNLLLDRTLGLWGAGAAMVISYALGLMGRRIIVFRGFRTDAAVAAPTPTAGERL